MQQPIRFYDMFSGVGGFRAGLERAGGYECVGRCEKDKHADRAYRAAYTINESEVFYRDITKINSFALPPFDLLTAGCPCLPFSNAGKREGFLDPRGNLFFDVARLVGAKRPAYLLFESTPGLLSHDSGKSFARILTTLSDMGYFLEWQVLNSADFGAPQARRRVFVIGYLDKRCAGAVLPFRSANAKTFIHPASSGGLLIQEATKRGYMEAFPGDSVNLSFPGSNTKRGRVGRGIAHTLDTGNTQGVVTADGRIRRLLPRECFRLQGFNESQIDRFLEHCSDARAYKLAGNATTVNVVHALGKRLKKAHEAIMATTAKTATEMTTVASQVKTGVDVVSTTCTKKEAA